MKNPRSKQKNQHSNKTSVVGPKIVTLDIETAPMESYHWGIWDINVSLEQILVEWSVLSYSAKWLGKPEVIYKSTGGRGASKVRDDSELLKDLWEILDEADIVVAQNGKAFDIKKINSRLLMKGFGPYSPIKIVDTMLVAKNHFGFTSNKLKWMSEHLTETKKSSHKLFPGFELWSECLKDNPKAWAEMKKYNQIDVLATEQLYLKFLPWIEGHPNVGVWVDSEDIVCPKCGSKHVNKRGWAYTQFNKYPRYKCNDCGGWSRGRTTTNSPVKRKNLLSN